MKRLITVLCVVCLFGVAEARKCTVTGDIPLFTSMDAMAVSAETFQQNKDLGVFLMGEMIAKGYIVKPKLNDELVVLHTLPNGVCQVLVNGKVYYTIEQALKCK